MAGKIFISHTQADATEAERIVRMLQPLVKSKKFAIWSDQQIEQGDSWETELRKALDESDIVIAVLSPEYVKNKYTTVELGAAYGAGKRLLPVVVEPFDSQTVTKWFDERQFFYLKKSDLLNLHELTRIVREMAKQANVAA
jgi:nucleoside 2-deoxyribosyltransferase